MSLMSIFSILFHCIICFSVYGIAQTFDKDNALFMVVCYLGAALVQTTSRYYQVLLQLVTDRDNFLKEFDKQLNEDKE